MCSTSCSDAGCDGIKRDLIARYKTYNTVNQTRGHVYALQTMKHEEVFGGVCGKLLEIEFGLACIDPIVRQRGTQIIHCQSRPRLVL